MPSPAHPTKSAPSATVKRRTPAPIPPAAVPAVPTPPTAKARPQPMAAAAQAPLSPQRKTAQPVREVPGSPTGGKKRLGSPSAAQISLWGEPAELPSHAAPRRRKSA
jgi:hypothetical protein